MKYLTYFKEVQLAERGTFIALPHLPSIFGYFSIAKYYDSCL